MLFEIKVHSYNSVGAGKLKYMLQNVPLNQHIFQKSYFLQVKRISVNK